MSSKTVFALILLSVVLSVIGQLSMKSGMQDIGKVDLAQIFLSSKIAEVVLNPLVILGLIAYSFAAILWLAVLSKAELSYAYPMIAMGYIIASIVAWILFKENMTILRFLGIASIISGVYLISLKK
jgi:drug/metabolite transporter (DMT)-like permease